MTICPTLSLWISLPCLRISLSLLASFRCSPRISVSWLLTNTAAGIIEL